MEWSIEWLLVFSRSTSEELKGKKAHYLPSVAVSSICFLLLFLILPCSANVKNSGLLILSISCCRSTERISFSLSYARTREERCAPAIFLSFSLFEDRREPEGFRGLFWDVHFPLSSSSSLTCIFLVFVCCRWCFSPVFHSKGYAFNSVLIVSAVICRLLFFLLFLSLVFLHSFSFAPS